MIRKVLMKVYESRLSKKLGIYKNPRLRGIKIFLIRMRFYAENASGIRYAKRVIQGKRQLEADFLQEKTYSFMYGLSLVSPKVWSLFLDKVAEFDFAKMKEKDCIEVMFLCNFSDTWSCDELYQMFLNSPKYHPYIVVHHFYNGTQQTIEESVEKTYCFFSKKGYEVYTDYDVEKKCFYTINQFGRPDIIFHLSPYNWAFPKEWDVFNYPLTVININVPYGIYVAELSDAQYRLPSFSAYWRIFDLPFYVKMADKYTHLGSRNRVGSGYCKLDVLYGDAKQQAESIWKIEDKNQVKIIYAPHHSIGNMGQKFSTFDKNHMLILDIAKKMRSETTWVLKPHPLLKKATVEAGVFATEEEYEAYIKAWNELPNAKVITGGDYFDLFKTSDGMILDSDSFLAEYMFVNKPIMLLSRESQQFSDLGLPLSKVLYRVKGDDEKGIEEFITNVLIHKQDERKESREKYFKEYLDYRSQNGMLASEFIFGYIDKRT